MRGIDLVESQGGILGLGLTVLVAMAWIAPATIPYAKKVKPLDDAANLAIASRLERLQARIESPQV